MAQEADLFLENLEMYNFNIFDEFFRKNSHFKVPYKFY